MTPGTRYGRSQAVSEPDPDVFASVADFDQHHAEAVDLLRQAPVFLLAVPRQDDDGDQQRIIMTGGGIGFDSFMASVCIGLDVTTSAAVRDALARSRQLRRVMLAAAAANIGLLAVNTAHLLGLW